MLELRRSTEGDAVVFRLDGTLTASEANHLKQEVRAVLAGGPPRVVLDLAGVEFVDSTGLGALVALHKSALEGGGSVRPRRLGSNVRAVLELTRLHRVLHVEGSARGATEPSESP